MYRHPEPGLHEYEAKVRICRLLKDYGFSLKDVAGLPTAFIAASGRGKPHIALLAEYDALDGIGHACGHHLIAGMSVLAGIGIASVLKSTGGTVFVIGSPAEETVGAKALLVKKGIFRNIDAAMMIHPADKTEIIKLSLSLIKLGVTFKGVSSHASASPWHGKNALAGMLALFEAIDANRTTIADENKINGIIKNGGAAANIIPDMAKSEFFLRSEHIESHDMLVRRFVRIVKGVSKAFDLDYEIKYNSNIYQPLKPNFAFARIFERQLKKLRIRIDDFFTDKELGSSDVGNVSRIIPTIHPTLAISDFPCPAHSEAFKREANTPHAYKLIKTGASLLALTAVELYKKPALLSEIKKEHYKPTAKMIKQDSLLRI